MNHPEMANRLYQAMELAAIGSIPKLARKTSIDRGYLYRLANGEIRTPHKYLDTLSEAMGVNPLWLVGLATMKGLSRCRAAFAES